MYQYLKDIKRNLGFFWSHRKRNVPNISPNLYLCSSITPNIKSAKKICSLGSNTCYLFNVRIWRWIFCRKHLGCKIGIGRHNIDVTFREKAFFPTSFDTLFEALIESRIAPMIYKLRLLICIPKCLKLNAQIYNSSNTFDIIC